MGKLPRAGRVKTRLTRALSADQAAALYRAFLADTFRLVDRALAADVKRVFACALAPDDALSDAEALVPTGWTVVAQDGDGLGDRIERARQQGEADLVVVMGSDSPTLPDSRLVDAFGALETAAVQPTVVVAPTADGGYSLVGFSMPALEVLTDIPWSTEQVMEATRSAAAAAGIDLIELDETYDVDHPEDLSRLRRDADPALHPNTVAALASVGAIGV